MDELTCIWFGIVDVLDEHAGAITTVATIVIAAFTIALAYSTKALTRLAKQQEKTARTHERAYVFSSPRAKKRTPGTNDIPIFIEAENYGRTPASVKEIRWKICREDEIPEIPDYGECESAKSYLWLSPQVRWATKARDKYLLSWSYPHVIYGRIYYEDIFKKSHSGGFLLRIQTEGVVQHFPIEGKDEAYTEWD